jgi:hypothetical protein
MGESRTPFNSAPFSPHVIRSLIWALGLDALKRAEKDPQLQRRIKAAIMRYLFSAALGGGGALGRMAGFPEPRIELPDLRRSPQLDLSNVQLYLDYRIAYQTAKRVWPTRRSSIARWKQELLKELPDLTQRDIPQCQTPSETAFISVARKHSREPETVMRLVRRLPCPGSISSETPLAHGMDSPPRSVL